MCRIVTTAKCNTALINTYLCTISAPRPNPVQHRRALRTQSSDLLRALAETLFVLLLLAPSIRRDALCTQSCDLF